MNAKRGYRMSLCREQLFAIFLKTFWFFSGPHSESSALLQWFANWFDKYVVVIIVFTLLYYYYFLHLMPLLSWCNCLFQAWDHHGVEVHWLLWCNCFKNVCTMKLLVATNQRKKDLNWMLTNLSNLAMHDIDDYNVVLCYWVLWRL